MSAPIVIWLLLVSGGTAHPRHDTTGSDAVWGDLVIPGGPQALLEHAGVSSSIEEWRAVPAVIELFYGGLNPRIPRTFRGYGARAASEAANSRAPLPLGPDFWARVLTITAPEATLASILASRAAASLYYGLLCMDTATLRAVQEDAQLASVLIRHAERLPVQAKAIRVHGARIRPAGGDALAPLWEDLIGPLERPSAFVEQLLTRDDGRLGYFYNTLDALPPPVVSFAGGESALPLEARRERFRALYAVFSNAMPTWTGRERRFFPMRGGPASALFALTVDADGTLAGPSSLAIWQRAFGQPASSTHDLRQTPDAADLLKLVCSSRGCPDEQVHMLAFIQRQGVHRSSDAIEPLVSAARARLRFPVLALELERLRLDDVSVYADAAAVAERIEDLPQERRRAALVQFQGAITLLRRMRMTGLSAQDGRRHLAGLLTLPLHGDGYRGAVLRWLVADVLNAGSSDIDAAAIRMLAGQSSSGEAVEWEGLQYRVDLAATEAQRIEDARARFDRHDLSTAWALLEKSEREADAAAAKAIATLVYSAEIQDPATPVVLSRELPTRHDFFSRVPGDTLPPSWTLPSVRPASGNVRHVGGALLALDSGAPELASRRLGLDRPPERAQISPVLADGLRRTAALTSPWSGSAADAARVADAAERGRALALDAQALERSLTRGGIAGPRAGWIRWAVASGKNDAASMLRLEDLVRLGDLAPVTTLGTAAAPLACVCLQFPAVTWEMRGQPADPFTAATLTLEAPLRVVQELQARKLPAVLAPGVLSLLAADIIDGASLAHPADVHGIADSIRQLPTVRFDDYIAAIAARGPLVAVSSASTPDR